MPALSGQFLTGRQAILPDAAKGKVTLLALGFTYDSRFAVEAWTGRWRKQFGADTRTAFFEVPMLGGMARMGKWFIESGMRRGTPAEDHERVITVYGGADAWKRRFNCRQDKAACLILLDAQGNIHWNKESMFDESAWKDLEREATALLDAVR